MSIGRPAFCQLDVRKNAGRRDLTRKRVLDIGAWNAIKRCVINILSDHCSHWIFLHCRRSEGGLSVHANFKFVVGDWYHLDSIKSAQAGFPLIVGLRANDNGTPPRQVEWHRDIEDVFAKLPDLILHLDPHDSWINGFPPPRAAFQRLFISPSLM
jgi:hypothetical protein